MTPLATLKATRALIADPSKWTQMASCRDRNGVEHMALSPLGVCWCLYGAMAHVANDRNPPGWIEMWDACGNSDPIQFNDSHKHPEVIAVLDKAIATLSRSERRE